jgi:hypothetical protein
MFPVRYELVLHITGEGILPLVRVESLSHAVGSVCNRRLGVSNN